MEGVGSDSEERCDKIKPAGLGKGYYIRRVWWGIVTLDAVAGIEKSHVRMDLT